MALLQISQELGSGFFPLDGLGFIQIDGFDFL
jgi:hypothetical protein